MNFFDPVKHQYFINGRPVSSVTQILRAVLGDAIWSASDWYLERGKAVHACAALIAQGKQFEHDPQIAGQVAACRKFFTDMKIDDVLEVEGQVFSERYLFGGTLDLRCKIGAKEVIVDWKSALSEVGEIQIGGYSVERPSAKYGMVVALLESGKYKAGNMFKLDRPRNEFLADLSVFNQRKRMGLIKTQEAEDGE